jgi:cellulose biosynthesis protein BcsQ
MTLPGSIVTFYSYKGGVGRTMALANVAWLFAANGRRVLMVDWDLEAPGLHRYFYPFLNDPALRQSRGLLDLLLDYVTLQQTDPKKRPADINDLMSLANIGRVAIRIDYDFSNTGCLHIVGPGIQDNAYAQRLQNFDWRAFYDMYEGATFIDKMSAYIREQYDIAFIDSRTGVADTSGICTLQIPDMVVLCFTYNRQSIEGTQMVADAVMVQNKPVRILLRPMRVEKDVVGIQAARSYARSVLGPYIKPFEIDRALLPTEMQRGAGFTSYWERAIISYWDRVEVPNYPAYSFEEILAVFGEVAGGRNNLLADMELLASEIDNAPISMPPLLEYSRQSTLARFRWSDRDRVFISYSHHDIKWVTLLKTVLVPVIGNIDIWDDTMIRPGERWRSKIQASLRSAKVAVLLVSPEFLASEFISTNELPSLLNVEVEAVWCPISPSLVDRTPIVNYQAVINPARPLSAMRKAEQSEALVRMAKEIEKAYYA